ncbi:ABC transporter permease [Chitinophaga agrisoli]|uniref:ABC transporter permease n=1 Tax=Chitinophaga agrisoli TaxID=2607653 RepID=A0A5B2VUV5_9BACT|nr:ABC transporter permease [Chitinophaga agrisoli]KAA2242554.1 ABC transporter permease [Chitinophaga agrisoli]
MKNTIPATAAVYTSLLRADFTTLWRNRRAAILVFLVPVVILISWKGIVDKMGGAFALSMCITIGLTAIGLMGYTISIARDRDKGIFQRLRVAPVPSWTIMASRITVQIAMITALTLLVFIVGANVDKVVLTPAGYIFGLLMALAGGAVYLGLGQMIVGLIKNPEAVNATTRLVYFAFIMIGMFGELGVLGESLKQIVIWSPFGTVKRIVSDSLYPGTWSQHTSMALLVTIGYAIVFTVLGIKWFRWNTK